MYRYCPHLYFAISYYLCGCALPIKLLSVWPCITICYKNINSYTYIASEESVRDTSCVGYIFE